MQSSITSVKMKLQNPGTFTSSGNLWNVCAKKFSEKFPEHSLRAAKASLAKAAEGRRVSKYLQSLEARNKTQLSALGTLKYSGDSRKVSIGLSPVSRFYSPKCYKLMPTSSTNSLMPKRYASKLHSNKTSQKTEQQAVLAYFRKNVETPMKPQLQVRGSKGFATSSQVSSYNLSRSEYADYTNDLVAQREQVNGRRKPTIWSSVMGARSESVKGAAPSLSPSHTALKGAPYNPQKGEETFNSNLMDINRTIKNLISLGPRRNIYFIPRTANLSDPLCGWKHPTQFLPVDVQIKPKNVKFPKLAQAFDTDTKLERPEKREKPPAKQNKVLQKKSTNFLNKLLIGYDRSEPSMKMNNYSYRRQKILYSAEEKKKKYGVTSSGDLPLDSKQNDYEAGSRKSPSEMPKDSSCVKLRKNFLASGTKSTSNTNDREQLKKNQERQQSYLHSIASSTGNRINIHSWPKLALKQQSASETQGNESTVDAEYQEKFSKKMETIASLQDLIRKCPQSQAILYLANKY